RAGAVAATRADAKTGGSDSRAVGLRRRAGEIQARSRRDRTAIAGNRGTLAVALAGRSHGGQHARRRGELGVSRPAARLSTPRAARAGRPAARRRRTAAGGAVAWLR